ncbi:MAG: PAS domain-containing protein, partial [Thermomicrobiales bacterium]
MMNPTLDIGHPDTTFSAVSCPWRFYLDSPPESDHQMRWWSNLTGQPVDAAFEHWIDAVHPDDRETVGIAWQRAIEGGEPYLSVYRVIARGGETHLLLTYGLPQSDGEIGKPSWSGQIIDITLYERSTTYAAAVSDLIARLSRESDQTAIPEITLEVVQRACQADAAAVLLPEASGSGVVVAAATGFPDRSLAALLDFSGAASDISDPALPALPGFPTVLSARFPRDGGAGAVAVGFAHIRSITEVDRDFVEAVALHTAQALQITQLLDAEREARIASEWAHRHLDLIANAVPVLIAYLDRDGTLQFTNGTFAEWLGIRELPPGSTLADVANSAVYEQLEPALRRALSGEATLVNLTLPAGSSPEPRSVDLTLEPNTNRGGEVSGLALLGFDVSERERAIARSNVLIEFGAALSRAVSHDEVIDIIVKHGAQAFSAASVAVVLAEAGAASVWSGPWEDAVWQLQQAVLPSDSPVWRMMERNRPTVFRFPEHGEALNPVLSLMPHAAAPGLRMVVPMTIASQRSGALVFSLPEGKGVSAPEIGHFQLAAGVCASAIERARLHDSLQEREQRFRHLADALPQIVWVSSGDGSRIEYLNRRWEEFTGVDAESVSAVDVSQLTHPDDREKEHLRWQRSLQTGELFETEVRLRRSDGAYLWFLNRGVPITNAYGEVETWFGTLTDIDAQRTALTHQSVVATLDTQIRLLSDPNQILQTLVRTVGRHLQVDRCFLTEVDDVEQAAGTGHDGLPAIAVRALWVADESAEIDRVRQLAPRLSRQFAADLRPGLVIAVNDLQVEAPNEEARSIAAELGVRSIVIVPYVRAGHWVAGITVHSLTPRRWTPAELAIVESAMKRTWPLVERSRAVEALAESENRLRHAAEAASFSNFDFDPRSGLGYWSADTARVFRRQDARKPPTSLDELVELIHPDDRQRLADLISSAMDADSNDVFLGEFRHLTDDGETCWLLLRGRVHFSGSGEERVAERIRGILMDITPRKLEEEERLVALDAAAHDMKNPVATIRALAQVGMRLEERAETPNEPLAEILKSIEGATDRLTAVIGDVLDTAHMRAGRELPLQRSMIDLAASLRERVDEWREAHPDREFIAQLPSASVYGCWDEPRLRRVFDNLIGNAVKFSPDGGPITVRLRLATGAGPHMAVVSIVDQGIGIAAQDLVRVQQSFERGSNVPASIPGTGMGLIAARLITNQHGGDLTLE